LQWLQNTNEISVDNLHIVRRGPGRTFRNEGGGVLSEDKGNELESNTKNRKHQKLI